MDCGGTAPDPGIWHIKAKAEGEKKEVVGSSSASRFTIRPLAV
jgi:hypothetical protein